MPRSARVTVNARPSRAANWFDGIDRPIATANYGAIASFTRPSTPPSSSSTVLVNLTSYNEAGQPSQTTDPMGYVTQKTYDNAQRTTQLIEDFGRRKRDRSIYGSMNRLDPREQQGTHPIVGLR